MKEATGELNMTVITVIAIAAIVALFYAFIWPAIENSLKNNTCATFGEGWHFVGGTAGVDGAAGTPDLCCPSGVNSGTTCITAE